MQLPIEKIVFKAANEGSDILLGYYRGKLSVHNKISHQDLVTDADIHSQHVIEQSIRTQLTQLGVKNDEIGFIGEESLTSWAEHTFIIDPLDGTVNFTSRLPFFSINIAYIYEGVIRAGLIYQPLIRTGYYAEKNNGAYKIMQHTKEKLSIQKTTLQDSLLAAYFSSDEIARSTIFSVSRKLFPFVRGLRAFGAGSVEYAYFCDNLLQIIMYGHCDLWDIAAAKIIIQESGGMYTDWNGKEIHLELKNTEETYRILVCHPSILKEIVTKIAL